MTDITSEQPNHEPPRLRERAKQAMHRMKLQTGELSTELELPRRALVRWLGDSRATTKDVAIVEPKVAAWLTTVEQVDGIVERAHERQPEFLETPTAERILSGLAYAKANGDMVTIFGAPGVGKTSAIRHFGSQYPHVWIATITPACAAVVPALEEVSEAVGLREASAGARRLSRAIQARVRDVDGIIVIDEAQHLTMGAIEVLRSIHDATGVGLALVGNELSYSRLSGGRSAAYAQIHSRLGLRMHILPPGPKDVRVIANRWRVRDAKVLELLERIASKPGGLRSVTKVLRIATVAGANAPTFERVRGAVVHLGVEE